MAGATRKGRKTGPADHEAQIVALKTRIAQLEAENATLEALVFAYTTQRVDQDGDGIEDRVDPCPNDPADSCVVDFFSGMTCPSGQVLCADAFGDLACRDPFLCYQQGDANLDCGVDSSDLNEVAGVNDGFQGTEAFGAAVPTGPFNP